MSGRVELDQDTVERDLMRLVLTVVELLRQLMERQAVRRAESGGLTEDQEERIGRTLMLLEERMDSLCRQHGLRRSDLNLDLGPLGPLLPPEDVPSGGTGAPAPAGSPVLAEHLSAVDWTGPDGPPGPPAR
ncbi:gas vesicle protein K [Streptomyces pactum]|uniref:Gas vesicle protein K n=1 Tax=Streptomyces pactum TaxID=68249 RepID=A0ABS0NSK5_9ACTN|nr:gas vesicle protein K [Streptomyces pactum]MBH5338180.1 gas vesicle protein K [Streptomyces pactum]